METDVASELEGRQSGERRASRAQWGEISIGVGQRIEKLAEGGIVLDRRARRRSACFNRASQPVRRTIDLTLASLSDSSRRASRSSGCRDGRRMTVSPKLSDRR